MDIHIKMFKYGFNYKTFTIKFSGIFLNYYFAFLFIYLFFFKFLQKEYRS